jgi:hypothetical protein
MQSEAHQIDSRIITHRRTLAGSVMEVQSGIRAPYHTGCDAHFRSSIIQVLNYSAKRPPIRWRRRVLTLLTVALLLYVSSFEYMYWNRKPAMNMVYFSYTTGSNTTEECFYDFYFPVYWVQRRLLGIGQSHTWDRPDPVYPPGFEG